MRADRLLRDGKKEDWDVVILPGGLPGANTLRDHPDVQDLLRSQHAKNRCIAAICAAPIALGKAGLLKGVRATSYPGFEDQLSGASYTEDRVVADGNIITSRGAGTTIEFALAVIRRLAGEQAAREVAERIQYQH